MEVQLFHMVGALRRAIAHREQVERVAGYGVDSALLGTWKLMLLAVQEGKQLVIRK